MPSGDRDPTAHPSPGEPLPHDAATDVAPGRPDLDLRLVAALERTGHALRVLLWQQARRHGLSPIQVQLLELLASGPPVRRRVGVLAADLDVRSPTVSDAVAALKRKGLVEDVPVLGDGRMRQLDLTADGDRVVAELADWHGAVAGRLEAAGAARKADTLELLLDLVASLQRDGVITVARTCPGCRYFVRDAAPGADRPHRCGLLDAPLGRADLRVDCDEHEPVVA